jgi:hypothetical protein
MLLLFFSSFLVREMLGTVRLLRGQKLGTSKTAKFARDGTFLGWAIESLVQVPFLGCTGILGRLRAMSLDWLAML